MPYRSLTVAKAAPPPNKNRNARDLYLAERERRKAAETSVRELQKRVRALESTVETLRRMNQILNKAAAIEEKINGSPRRKR